MIALRVRSLNLLIYISTLSQDSSLVLTLPTLELKERDIEAVEFRFRHVQFPLSNQTIEWIAASLRPLSNGADRSRCSALQEIRVHLDIMGCARNVAKSGGGKWESLDVALRAATLEAKNVGLILSMHNAVAPVASACSWMVQCLPSIDPNCFEIR